MTLVEIRSATITEKGQIAIPRGMRKQKSFKTGSKIAILSYDDHIELRPMNQIHSKMETVIASEKSLAKSWNSKEDEKAWKNL
jgi:AbrB family looped-hinge helix DNA binding protein